MSAGTLRLSEDDTGLLMDADLPDTQWARDLAVSIERGDITGQSFQFRVKRQEWKEPDPGKPGLSKRTLLEVDLIEVGPVAVPAYPDTTVALRSLEQHRADQAADGGVNSGGQEGLSVRLARARLRIHEITNP